MASKPYMVKSGFRIVPRRQFTFQNPVPVAGPAPQYAPRYAVPPRDELLVLTSSEVRCGVAEYAAQLDGELRALGVKLREHPIRDTSALRNVPPGTPVLVHAEPSLLGADFDMALDEAVAMGAYVATCFHYLDRDLLRRFETRSHALVSHRTYDFNHPNMRVIPLGCPVYEPSASREELRQKYNLPIGEKILTTAGFLSPWKKFPEIVAAFLPHLKEQNLWLQLCCPGHFSGQSSGEIQRINALRTNTNGERVIWQSDFVPAAELVERCAASDLGFVFHNTDTGSVSAATKQFVAARCPIVVTSSNHASDLQRGVVRVGNLDIGNFISQVLGLANSPTFLASLRADIEEDYRRLNMREIARQYVQVFSDLGVRLCAS